MDVEDYIKLLPQLDTALEHPNTADYLRQLIAGHKLEVGMLKVEDNSFYWAPTFPGDYVLYILKDFTHVQSMRGGSLLEKNARTLVKERTEWETNKHRRKNPFVFAGPLPETPIEVHMLGADDASYSKWYSTLAGAREELQLLLACQPVDTTKDLLKNGFVFTN